MTWSAAPISINAVIDDKLYIGNLPAALSVDVRKKLGISHLLSVCTEHTFDPQPNAMVVSVQDSEYEDLLIHLSETCLFIDNAINNGGRVLVHCMMGISRSTTVVCAYLMMSQRMSVSAAIQYVRKRRPQVHPNYGFVKQLHAFAACRYKPTCNNPEYIAWKRRQKRDVTKYLNTITDCIPVIPDQLYLTSEFPGDPEAAESLLLDLGVTHLLSISSAQLPKPTIPPIFQHCFVNVPNNAREELLLGIPNTCKFITEAIANGGQVLVQSRVELRACIIVCAYLMFSRNISPRRAYGILEAALPLYNSTATFYRHLELFSACNYCPTWDHPLVQAWLAEQSGGPPVKLSAKPQSVTQTAGVCTNPPTLAAINTTPSLSNLSPLSSCDTTFDLVSLSNALGRYQPASAVAS